MHLPLAFSIHHFISSVGADAGFAAIIGLAILVLLYFAQARETTTLRDEAISASQRVEQLERHVAQLGGPPVAPAPESATAAAPGAQGAPAGAGAAPGATGGGMRVASARAVANPLPAATPGAATPGTGGAGPQRAPLPSSSPARPLMPIPAAPAGVGAPALTDATRLIPVTGAAVEAAAPDGREAPGQTSAPPGEKAARETPAPQVGEAPAPQTPGTPAPQTPETAAAQTPETPAPQEPETPAPQEEAVRSSAAQAAVATPPPATPPPATAAAGAGQSQTAGTSAAPPAAANGGGEPRRARPAAAAAQPPRRINIRSEGARRSPPVLLGTRRGGNRWLPVVIGALLLGAVVAVLLVATSGGGSSHSAAATRSTNAHAVTGAKSAFSPASVTVAVLNGTNVSQLAHRVEQKLKQAGYKGGTVATASDQTHTASVVGYLPGHQRAAAHVASSLGLGSGVVQQLDQSARAVACPPPSACGATVVVTVGSDLSSTR